MFIGSLCRNEIQQDELAAVSDRFDGNIRRLLVLHTCDRSDCGIAKFLATLPKE